MFVIRNKITKALFTLPLTGVWVANDIEEAVEMKQWLAEVYAENSNKSKDDCKELLEIVDRDEYKRNR